MNYRRLGRSGLKVSEIALGSWLTFGFSVDRAGTTRCVRTALDLGINFIDTADVYAGGQAETVLGEALDGIPRESYVLASKAYFPVGEGPNDRGLSRKHIVESVEASLRRLDTDYLDLWQCHRFDEETPVEEVVRTVDGLVRRGRILYWGVSCWPAQRIAEACAVADRLGADRPVSNQPPYNLLDRGIETEVLPACEREGVGQVVFSPLAQGVLTGKYGREGTPPGCRGADIRANQWIREYLRGDVTDRVATVASLASDLGIPVAALALAWCLRHPSVNAVITGATRPEQIAENVKAAGVKLPPEVLSRLDTLFPRSGATA